MPRIYLVLSTLDGMGAETLVFVAQHKVKITRYVELTGGRSTFFGNVADSVCVAVVARALLVVTYLLQKKVVLVTSV